MAQRKNSILVPESGGKLDALKYDVAKDLGLITAAQAGSQQFSQFLDKYKYEVAKELGLYNKIVQIGWPNMTSKECGRIGGHVGGRIGGQMVKRMIEFAEAQMK